ncbi:ComEC/Rec2 family competence protein [Streptomyces sp. NPDC056323]|uniref:ComEC/Rec2 family competence protein n=1 Tax=Streptomyces sp. NPDC056323 TaxID=3345784 RepID=UPI0035D672A9
MTTSADQIVDTLEVTVLDVGHGNCAVIRDGTRCVVVDAPPGTTLFDELERCGITHIDHLVLSHSDLDHMGSAVKLLWDTRFLVGMIWYNPDGTKQSKAWQNLARQAYLRYREGALLNGQRNLNTASSADLAFSQRANIEVLHPDLEMATLGPSASATPIGRLTANTLSAVLRVSLNGSPAVLLPADIDALALERMISFGVDLKSHVLVFPHHGGKAKTSDSQKFATTLCQAVEPDLVLFSMARGGRFSNPDPEMVSGVRSARPHAHIACTQISTHCHRGTPPPAGNSHLSLHAAAGSSAGSCCAGTVTIGWGSTGLETTPSPQQHKEFIQLLDRPLCRSDSISLPVPHSRDSSED